MGSIKKAFETEDAEIDVFGDTAVATYRYRIVDHEALSDPDICLLYRRRPYPEDALIPRNRIHEIIQGLSQLRTLDDTLYLRSASINIFNGLISLTFSCDGTHYMSWSEFLEKDMAFWVGSAS